MNLTVIKTRRTRNSENGAGWLEVETKMNKTIKRKGLIKAEISRRGTSTLGISGGAMPLLDGNLPSPSGFHICPRRQFPRPAKEKILGDEKRKINARPSHKALLP